jgi:hypothetical protein
LRTRIILLLTALLVCGSPVVRAQYAFFTRDTDTIRVEGTPAISGSGTIEAVLMLVPVWSGAGDGVVYDAWAQGLQDQRLSVFPTAIWTVMSAMQPNIASDVPVAQGVWHHVAFVVQNSTNKAIYLDGVRVTNAANSGSVGVAGAKPQIGAVFRDARVYTSFHGVLKSVRLSSIARYTGATSTTQTAAFQNDASTLFLLNFNATNGATTLYDSSTNQYACSLGAGFAGATAPVIGPLPTLEIQAPALSPVVSWSTVTNLTYQLQHADDGVTNWTNQGGAISNAGPVVSHVDTTTPANIRSYRLLWSAP